MSEGCRVPNVRTVRSLVLRRGIVSESIEREVLAQGHEYGPEQHHAEIRVATVADKVVTTLQRRRHEPHQL